jgi:hypothetical protein
MSTENKAVGRCICGAVKFVADLPPLWCINCHCYFCRRSHGAAFVTWFGVPSKSFRLGGREHLKWWYSDEECKLGFCGNCGSSFLFLSAKWPDEVHVALGSIVNDVDISPTAHIFFDQHVGWYPFGDSLPRLGGERGFDLLEGSPGDESPAEDATTSDQPDEVGRPDREANNVETASSPGALPD